MSDYYDAHTGAEITDYEAHKKFDQYLDEVLGTVTIGGLTYAPSYALQELDPIAYRCEFSDWTSEDVSGLVESGYWTRVMTEDGIEVDGFTEWYVDEDDAVNAAAGFAEDGFDGAPAGVYVVQAYGTDDRIVSEHRVIVA